MKTLIISILIIVCTTAIYSQTTPFGSKDVNSNFTEFQKTLEEFRHNKDKQITTDTLWLYTRYENYLWINDNYELQQIGIYNYNMDPNENGYGLPEYFYSLDPQSEDSILKVHFVYDSSDRATQYLYQMYDSVLSSWVNFTLTNIAYDINGHDSCSLYQSWNIDSATWVNTELHKRYRNYQEAITFDVFEQWTGSGWYRYDGHKFDYFNNAFGCTDSIHIFDWHTVINDWFMKHKWFLTFDENHVQTSGLDRVFDSQLQQWRNYQQTLEYKFDNWCGCEGFWGCDSNPSHFIIQNWYDTSWVNIEQFFADYDSLDGSIVTMQSFNGIQWVNSTKDIMKFISPGQVDYFTRSTWGANQWNITDGIDNSYIYNGNQLIKRITDQWDNQINNWAPKGYKLFQNYIGVPLITSIDENRMVSQNKLTLIPNPVHAELISVELTEKQSSIDELIILDINGQIVLRSAEKTNKIDNLNVSALKTGVYIIRAQTNKGKIYQTKLIRN